MDHTPNLRLLYLRHGETDLNRRHLMQGDLDEPLNELGRKQIVAAAKRLEGENISAVYSSDLIRARETGEIAAAPHGLPVTADPRVREQSLGTWEGKNWFKLEELFGEDARNRFLGDLDFAPEGGESRRQVRDRIRSFLDDLVKKHTDGETVLLASHGGPLFVLFHDVLDLPYSPRKRFFFANGGLSTFLYTNTGWQLVSFNETWFQAESNNPTLD